MAGYKASRILLLILNFTETLISKALGRTKPILENDYLYANHSVARHHLSFYLIFSLRKILFEYASLNLMHLLEKKTMLKIPLLNKLPLKQYLTDRFIQIYTF